ncbi:Glycosyl hydrolase, family 13, all-beta [Nannochloropsis gaditana]|uniref:Glycosyl hydrolase, family 13, all-beta n=1 Tax=Nannochloropsis gaditana TaxID=72520 RepID=W7UCD6_9STRA|nr:Glycosyl hydrolase, family 13, all-beta [Nannochloropsis gaditana]
MARLKLSPGSHSIMLRYLVRPPAHRAGPGYSFHHVIIHALPFPHDRAAEMVSALLPPSISGAWQKDLESARRDADLFPHHDNLPATGYNFNNVDLLVRLDRAQTLSRQIFAQALHAWLAKEQEAIDPSSPPPSLPSSFTFNADAARAIDDGQAPVSVLVVNTLGWPRNATVTIRVSRSDLKVTCSLQPTMHTANTTHPEAPHSSLFPAAPGPDRGL